MQPHTDFLLLNASNYPTRPIFPYAFVQVSALARRRGLAVRRFDMLRVRRDAWGEAVGRIVDAVRPRVVGLTLRQTDSMNAREYDEEGEGQYLPIRDTRDVVRAVRRHTDAPVIVGGFGFGIQPQRTLEAVEADAGVIGEPDALFDCFDDFAERRLVRAPANYLGAEGFGERELFGPLDDAEYDDELLGELETFYGRQWLAGPQAPTVAVEVARGCPYRCFFCTEPRVKGRRVRRRNLDAAFDDVERIARRGHRRIWFVCSEANIGGGAMLMEITERMRRLNETRGDDPLSWTTYALPHLDREQLAEMTASGWFLGGFNDVASLDDAELRRGGMPYRSRHALRFMTSMRDHAREHAPRTDDWILDRRRHLGLFLADPSLTVDGLRTTLQRLDGSGMLPGATAEVAETAFVITGLRVYEKQGDPTRPTFRVPAALREALGGVARVGALCRYLEQVVLCSRHRRERDDDAFVARRRRRLATWLGRDVGAYEELRLAVHRQLATLWEDLGVERDAEGIPTASDFSITRVLWQARSRRGSVRACLRPHVGPAWPLAFAVLVHEYAIPLDPALLELLMSPCETASPN